MARPAGCGAPGRRACLCAGDGCACGGDEDSRRVEVPPAGQRVLLFLVRVRPAGSRKRRHSPAPLPTGQRPLGSNLAATPQPVHPARSWHLPVRSYGSPDANPATYKMARVVQPLAAAVGARELVPVAWPVAVLPSSWIVPGCVVCTKKSHWCCSCSPLARIYSPADEFGGDVGHPQHAVGSEQRREAGAVAHHRRVGELAAQRLDLHAVAMP